MPNKINLLHIKNFKSIVNVSMKDVSNFSIFAGANGVGKSNIFEAIEFFKTVIEFNAVNAIKRYGGYDNIHSRKVRKENARFLKRVIKQGFDIDRANSHTSIFSLNYFIEKLDRFKESN